MAKYPLLVEGSQNLILQHLKDNFNNAVLDTDNSYSDGINIEPIEGQSFYTDESFMTLNPPAVYVLGGDMTLKNSESANYVVADIVFIVAVTTENVGADKLKAQSQRYARVLFGLLDQANLGTSDGRLQVHLVVNRVLFSDTAPTKKMSEASHMYRKDCYLEVTAQHFEKKLE